eukprot:CAMPEP_0175987440 /NCGR_PEP_ID=MMETSP0108-20121206/50704_1 /TAXON_ID=195067 ORGANISM="Goniomonas pacifica, Strain CCMP1869" /NCGR_SAMPLE_ID=MMETSP0108 /ASSEMBLY_ACC=CAM_ASM_000204 /LENGTH=64 /DNA_ID=CAMNT_0017318705 /DNA_START=522 /DNA_END=716 /DNA_ORIENTATION=-
MSAPRATSVSAMVTVLGDATATCGSGCGAILHTSSRIEGSYCGLPGNIGRSLALTCLGPDDGRG